MDLGRVKIGAAAVSVSLAVGLTGTAHAHNAADLKASLRSEPITSISYDKRIELAKDGAFGGWQMQAQTNGWRVNLYLLENSTACADGTVMSYALLEPTGAAAGNTFCKTPIQISNGDDVRFSISLRDSKFILSITDMTTGAHSSHQVPGGGATFVDKFRFINTAFSKTMHAVPVLHMTTVKLNADKTTITTTGTAPSAEESALSS